jgi:hypothetical protein
VTIKFKFNSVLICLGLLAVASLHLVALETLVPEGQLDLPPHLLKLVLLIQPVFLTMLAIFVGIKLGPRLGLEAPAIRAITSRHQVKLILKSQFAPALIVGLASSIILLGYGYFTESFFTQSSDEMFAKVLALSPPLITKILYGGIGEELIMRWGLMTLVIWAICKVKKHEGLPSFKIVWVGIGVAALLFALGHLPVLFGISDQPPLWMIVSVVLGNALPGLGFGWLFYKFGIEAAMMAHALTHIITTIILGTLG